MNPRNLLAALCISLSVAPLLLADDDAPRPLMRDMMGINGHTVQFEPRLYAPLCRLVRDYHGFGWDVGDDTSTPTTFPLADIKLNWSDPAGVVRPYRGQLNWETLYRSWQKEGFEINACVQFGNQTIDKWKDPAADAYRYGKAFAEFFGPSGKHKLVTSMEIGNEPAGRDRFSDEDYMTIFRNMARGVREGDPKLKILTCTAGAHKGAYSKDVNLFKDEGALYDVINVHKYAQVEGWPTWRRTYPEDASFDYLGIIQKTIDWRNEHAPDKEIWVTEFGYDSSTREPDPNGTFKKWQDVTDVEQARYIVRSYLCFAAMDLDRAYLYWFNDRDTPSLHAASGVTRDYKPKPSYWAMRHLFETLGDYRFAREIERKDGEIYVFEFVHGENPARRVWVAWSPTDEDREVEVTLDVPARVSRAALMPLKRGRAPMGGLVSQRSGKLVLKLSESPTYMWLTVP